MRGGGWDVDGGRSQCNHDLNIESRVLYSPALSSLTSVHSNKRRKAGLQSLVEHYRD